MEKDMKFSLKTTMDELFSLDKQSKRKNHLLFKLIDRYEFEWEGTVGDLFESVLEELDRYDKKDELEYKRKTKLSLKLQEIVDTVEGSF